MSEVNAIASDPLLSILPIGRELVINGGKALVTGVSWNFIGKLIGQVPSFADELAANQLSIATALTSVPECIPAFLAAGIGRPDDKTAEAILGKLPAHQQLDMIAAVVRETMGGDRDFFVEKLKRTAKLLGFGADAAPDGTETPLGAGVRPFVRKSA